MIKWILLVLFFLSSSPSIQAAKGEPPRIDENAQTKFRVPIGTKQFKLVCPILMSEQNVMIQWSRDGETLDFDAQYKIAKENREVRMKNLKLEDSGRYECQAVNGFGHRSIQFVLQVYDPATDIVEAEDRITIANQTSPPYWLDDKVMQQSTSQIHRINIGGKLELKCPARGNPFPEIRWFKNDELIAHNAPIDSAVLVIEPIREGESGSYRCEVANKLGFKQATFKVIVAAFFDADGDENGEVASSGPVPIIDFPYNLTVQYGRTAQFMCKVKAEDSPLTKVLIRWLKELTPSEAEKVGRTTNSTVVVANGKHLMVIDERQFPGKEIIAGSNFFTNRLIIPSSDYIDEGTYICVVTDQQGRIVYRTAELFLERGIRIGDLYLTPSVFWWIAIPLSVVFIIFVVFGVVYLRKTSTEIKEGKNQQPPPPRIPPPVAPTPDQVYPQLPSHHLSHFMLDKQPQSPLMLRDAMFQNGGRTATMDRMHTPHRLHRGLREEEMLESPHFHHHSPQSSPMYWGNSKSSNQPLLLPAPQMIDHSSMMDQHHRNMTNHNTLGGHHGGYYAPQNSYAPSSNYRTLDMNYCRDPHPSVYSSEYTDNIPFINAPRRHDL